MIVWEYVRASGRPLPSADRLAQWVFTMGLSLSTAVDVLITISLIILLQRSRTGFSTMCVSPLPSQSQYALTLDAAVRA